MRTEPVTGYGRNHNRNANSNPNPKRFNTYPNPTTPQSNGESIIHNLHIYLKDYLSFPIQSGNITGIHIIHYLIHYLTLTLALLLPNLSGNSLYIIYSFYLKDYLSFPIQAGNSAGSGKIHYLIHISIHTIRRLILVFRTTQFALVRVWILSVPLFIFYSPIYRWRQMRHGQFWGGMKKYNIKSVNFVHKFNN